MLPTCNVDKINIRNPNIPFFFTGETMKTIMLTDAHKEAMEVLPNIRQTLYILQNGPLNEDIFNAINGSDCAIENLLGKSVTLDSEDAAVNNRIKCEIVDKLRDQEYKTLSALRDIVASKEADVKAVLDFAADTAARDHAILRFNHRVSPKDFVVKATEGALSTGCFPAPATDKVTAALDQVSDFLNKVAPLMVRIYDEEQQTQEQEDAQPDENNGQGTGHQVYKPFHTEETEDAITEIIAACSSNTKLTQMAAKFSPSDRSYAELGYHAKEDVTKTIESFVAAQENFLKAARTMLDALPNETQALETFARNSSSYYAAVDAIIGLVNRADVLRARMNESIETLTALGK